MHRAHHIRINGIAACRPCNSKISHLHLALCGDNNILRLDVAMDDMLVVRGFDTPSDLNGDAHRLLKGELAFLLNIGL